MPPKQKFTKKEIIDAALDLVRKKGLSGVTARDLGAALGCTTSPVFTAFKNMDEVQSETVKAARNLYNVYATELLPDCTTFKSLGLQYIRFATDEPRLFELLFMTAREKAFVIDNVLPYIDNENNDRIINFICAEYRVSTQDAHKLYQNVWIFTHGIACLCATGLVEISLGEASDRLSEVFTGLYTVVAPPPKRAVAFVDNIN